MIGLYSFRKEVIKAFIDNGYKVTISCPNDETIKAEWFKNIGCDIIDTKFNRKGTNPLSDIKLMVYYRKIIKEITPEVVLTYTIKPNIYGGIASALCGVSHIANITGLGSAVEYPGIMQKITILLYKLGLRKTSLTFFQNNENRQFFIRNRMIKGENQLIPGSGVNLSYHTQKEYPSESEPIRFIFVSRIRREKGIEEYLVAAETLKLKYADNVEFHIVGWCEENYYERINSLNDKGIVVFHGFQGDVRPFNAMVHCGVHPTFYPEGMSNVLLEYCAAGRPIITTNRSGCREVVDDGVNGFIIKQKDASDLMKKIENFIKLPYEYKKKMGENARKKVELEFDRQIVINAYLNAIKQA